MLCSRPWILLTIWNPLTCSGLNTNIPWQSGLPDSGAPAAAGMHLSTSKVTYRRVERLRPPSSHLLGQWMKFFNFIPLFVKHFGAPIVGSPPPVGLGLLPAW